MVLKQGLRATLGVLGSIVALASSGCTVQTQDGDSVEETKQAVVAPCTIVYRVPAVWAAQNGNPPGLQADVTIINNSMVISGWTLKFTFGSGETVTSYWNSTVTQSGTAATAVNAPWNGTIPVNGSANFGYIASRTAAPTVPTNFKLNGVTCDVR